MLLPNIPAFHLTSERQVQNHFAVREGVNGVALSSSLRADTEWLSWHNSHLSQVAETICWEDIWGLNQVIIVLPLLGINGWREGKMADFSWCWWGREVLEVFLCGYKELCRRWVNFRHLFVQARAMRGLAVRGRRRNSFQIYLPLGVKNKWKWETKERKAVWSVNESETYVPLGAVSTTPNTLWK